MWIREKIKATPHEEETQTFVGLALDTPETNVDVVFLGGIEAVLAAILQKAEKPECSVAVVFKPNARDFAIPARFSPLKLEHFCDYLNSYTVPATLNATLLDLQKQGISKRTLMIATDMCHAFEARQHDGEAVIGHLKDEHETRHLVSHLTSDRHELTLEGSVELKGGVLFLLNELWRTLSEQLKKLDVLCFLPKYIELNGEKIVFDQGGVLNFAQLHILDQVDFSSSEQQAVIGLQTDLAQQNAILFETFHCYRLYRKETLFFGSPRVTIKDLKSQISRHFNGLEEVQISRQFYLPTQQPKMRRGLLRPKSFFSRLDVQGIVPLGIEALTAFVAADNSKPKIHELSTLKEAEKCFNGR